MHIPEIDARRLFGERGPARAAELDKVRTAAVDVGFMTVSGTDLDAAAVTRVLDAYRRFFLQPDAAKRPHDMSATGSNRGWGASGAEQVDPAANPDYKEVFDTGAELAADDPLRAHTYYAPNLWPDEPADFRAIVTDYYARACAVALRLLSAVARVHRRIPRPLRRRVRQADDPPPRQLLPAPPRARDGGRLRHRPAHRLRAA